MTRIQMSVEPVSATELFSWAKRQRRKGDLLKKQMILKQLSLLESTVKSLSGFEISAHLSHFVTKNFILTIEIFDPVVF